jgi:DNA replication and repair protein RecF
LAKRINSHFISTTGIISPLVIYMYLKQLSLSNFRNYKDISLEFPPEGAFFEGENGSGKTNLLESIYMLCIGRSQRNALKNEMVNFDSITASIEGKIISEKGEQIKDSRIVFNRNNIVDMKINGKKIASFAEWFGSQTIVSFSPDDAEIIHGNPAQRRKFLDVLISLFDKKYFHALIEYRKNLSLRNILLRTRMDDILCEIYEEKMSEAGSIICQKRKETLESLSKEFVPLYGEISAQNDVVFYKYEPSFMSDLSSIKTWKEVFYTMLCERRKKDHEIGFSSVGPHRDDVLFFINNKPAVKYASKGQSRSIVLSLKISSRLHLEKKTNKKPIILFDDAVSELDIGRTQRVFSLVEKQGQIFIASPGKIVPIKEKIKQYSISNGVVEVL